MRNTAARPGIGAVLQLLGVALPLLAAAAVRHALVGVDRGLQGFLTAGALVLQLGHQVLLDQAAPARERRGRTEHPEARIAALDRLAGQLVVRGQALAVLHPPTALVQVVLQVRRDHAAVRRARHPDLRGGLAWRHASGVPQRLEHRLEPLAAVRALPVPASAIAAVVQRQDPLAGGSLVARARHPGGARLHLKARAALAEGLGFRPEGGRPLHPEIEGAALPVDVLRHPVVVRQQHQSTRLARHLVDRRPAQVHHDPGVVILRVHRVRRAARQDALPNLRAVPVHPVQARAGKVCGNRLAGLVQDRVHRVANHGVQDRVEDQAVRIVGGHHRPASQKKMVLGGHANAPHGHGRRRVDRDDAA